MTNEPEKYVVSIPDGATWVCIEERDSLSPDQSRKMIKEAIEIAHNHGIHDFFYDGSLVTNTISIVEQYQLVHEDLTKYVIDQQSRLAILTSPEDSSRDFIETVLRNAGYNCKLFTSRAEATKWLQEKKAH